MFYVAVVHTCWVQCFVTFIKVSWIELCTNALPLGKRFIFLLFPQREDLFYCGSRLPLSTYIKMS